MQPATLSLRVGGRHFREIAKYDIELSCPQTYRALKRDRADQVTPAQIASPRDFVQFSSAFTRRQTASVERRVHKLSQEENHEQSILDQSSSTHEDFALFST